MLKIKALTNQLLRTTKGIVRQISTIFDSTGLSVLLAMRSKLILQKFWGLHDISMAGKVSYLVSHHRCLEGLKG